MRARSLGLAAVLLGLAICGAAGGADTYKLGFNKSSSRMSWTPILPAWSYAIPVVMAAGDSSALLRVSASASLGYTLDQREGRNLWQESASVRSSVNYPIMGPRASIGMSASMSSSTAALQKQDIRSQSLGFNFQYRPLQQGPWRTLSADVTPGLITASRASRAKLDSTIQEKGLQYTASLRLAPEFILGGRKLNSSFSLGKNDNNLKNNKDRAENLNLSLGYTWPREVRTSLSFSESRTRQGVTRGVVTEEEEGEFVRRDTAVVAELNQRRATSVSSNTSFKLLSRFDASGNAGYSQTVNGNTANAAEDPGNRFYARNRQGDRWNFDTRISGKVQQQLVGRANLAYSSSDDRRLPVRLANGRVYRDPADDRQDRDLYVSGSLEWQVGRDQSLDLTGQTRSVRDDSPGDREQNRDTYSTGTKLAYKGRLASGLVLNMSMGMDFLHKVNLDARRSSDNSRDRDLRLDFDTRYERLGASLTHGFGVSARRTVFDFDRQVNRDLRNRKSSIRRSWSMRHSIRRTVLQELQLNASYSYKAEDFGTLLVDEQAQVVKQDNADHSFSFGMSYKPGKALSLGATYSYRLDSDWEYRYTTEAAARQLLRRNRHRNLGVNFNYSPGPTSSLAVTASRSRQRSGTFDSFSISLMRTL